MKTKILCVVLAACLANGSAAFAQGRGDRGGDRDRGDRGGDRDRGARGPDRRDMDRRGDARGGAPFHFRRGDRLPPEYRHRNYVIDDWRGYHLRPPPRGYHWV